LVTHVYLLTETCSNNHIQDVLVVSYLANTIRTQMELSNRLAIAQLTLGGPDTTTGEGSQQGGQRGQRGGKGGRGGQQRNQARSTEEIRA
jgi:translation initiation factor 3 subunit F